MSTPQQALKQYFGFDDFREGQEETIRRVLEGDHTLLVMPTGSGKSLAYQLPALLLPGLTLVISPLISLMKDQVDGLVEAGIAAAYLNSTLPSREINRRIRAMLEGDLKILYIAPERLRNRQFTQALAKVEVSLLAVDEAHCISQWGHDFRPDYLQIGPTWQAMGKPTLLATTATATPNVQKDTLELLGLQSTHAIVTGFNRPNLTFRAKYAPDNYTRMETLEALLKNLDGSAIIYAATRRNTEEVADYIRQATGFAAGFYHGGMDNNLRHQIQNDFMSDRIKIVVATNAFGMGVDKPDVRLVAHYNMPGTMEAYYQEAGRAGRDGLPAECVLLFSPDDQGLQEWMIQSDTPTYDDLRQLYNLLAYAVDGGSVHANYYELQENTGLHPVKLRVALSELELAGLLYHLGNQSGYHSWKVQPFSERALRERARAIARRAEIRFDLLDKMLLYVHLNTCRRQYLLNYFGDSAPPKSPRCCDNHGRDAIEDLPKAVTPQEWYPLIILETVHSLPQKMGRSHIAKILSGSQSRRISQFKHHKHKFYGKLGRLSQKQIINLVDRLIEDHYLGTSSVEGQHRRFTVVNITPLGNQALDARVAIPLHLNDWPAPRPPRPAGAKRSNTSATTSATLSTRLNTGTVEDTLQLFKEGLTPAEIAAERELAENTIYTHLAKLIESSAVALPDIIPPEIEEATLAAVETAGSAAALSPIKALLPEAISWGQIKCVLAGHPELPRKTQDLATAETPEQRIVALGNTDDPSHIPELVAALDDGNSNVRRLAASALGKIGDQSAVRPLITLLEHKTKAQVRLYAIKALGKIKDPRATPILEQIATNPEEKDYNIKAAQNALKLMSKPHSPQSAHPHTRPPAHPPTCPPAPQPSSDIAPDVIILEAVARLGGALGRTGLAQLLSGSKVSWLETFAEHSDYGKLSEFSQRTTLDIIDALIADGKLRTTGGGRPKVMLPAQEEQGSGDKPALPKASNGEIGKQGDNERPKPPLPPLPENKELRSTEAILAVMEDLEGLLTPYGLALLLTSAPGDIAPFSDHESFGKFHGASEAKAVETEIQGLIEEGKLEVNRHGRLITGFSA